MKKDFSVSERMKAPTPKFFRILRTVGIVIGAVGGAIVAAPVALPAIVTTIAGYLVTAGTVAAVISQTTVDLPRVGISE
jgi:ABC-type xylose transport system permease subunit